METPEVPTDTAAHGRIAFHFGIRYLTPVMVLAALAASAEVPAVVNLTALLTLQVALALATHLLALRSPAWLNHAVWLGILLDLAVIGVLVATTGGPGGPLAFLYTLHALAGGILLSSSTGLRIIAMATASLLAMDIVGAWMPASDVETVPAGLISIAVLWIIGGGGTIFSLYNERELRRRSAELDTIRQVTLDIEESLTLTEIFNDLCRGVCDRFGFDGAAVLLRVENEMEYSAGVGITGEPNTKVPLTGRIAQALAMAAPIVTGTEQAAADGTLIPLIGARGYVAVPLAEDGILIATRNKRGRRAAIVRSNEIEALDRLAHHARLAIGNARLHARMQAMAVTDSLTGLANHGELQRRLSFECNRQKRYEVTGTGRALSLMMMDLDSFKRFNDEYGHQAGDAVLKGVAAAMRESVRSFDVVARYGGEEFAVILPETAEEGAMAVAERIRSAVASYPFPSRSGEKPAKVTVSIGVATSPANGDDPEGLIRAADRALYAAKAQGRDRVLHASTAEGADGVVPMEAKRRRRARDGDPARDGARPARAQSSRPKRRTPRA